MTAVARTGRRCRNRPAAHARLYDAIEAGITVFDAPALKQCTVATSDRLRLTFEAAGQHRR